MTLGMKGCYVYCCDAALAAHTEDAAGGVTVTRVG